MASLLRFCRSSVALTSLPSRSTAGVRLWSSSNESKDSKEVAVPKEGEGVTEYVTPEELVSFWVQNIIACTHTHVNRSLLIV